jgi:chromate transporter
MKKYFEMFLAFFKIGAFTIGGGYAMVPLIEKEVVENKQWIEKEEFVDMLALAQSSPGPIAVNTAVFVGYKTAGLAGCFFTILGAVLPSFLIIAVIASFFVDMKDNAVMERIFKGIRPAVVALVAAPVYRMGKSARINFKTLAIPVVAAIVVAYFNVTPIIVIVGAAVGGICYMIYRGRVKK